MTKLIFLIDYRKDTKTAFDFGFKESKKGGIDFRSFIFDEIEELEKLRKSKNLENQISEIIRNEYNKKNKQLEQAKKKYENIWKNFNSSKLENILPKFNKIIKVYISLFNCNPKYIERNYFQIYYKMNKKGALATICHELIHFIYFDAYRKLFKKDLLNGRQSWTLSEIIDVIILKDIGMYSGVYPEHEKFIPIFEELWQTEKKNGFNIFLKKAVALAKDIL